MPDAFIIMQIGDTSLDQVCKTAIVPAIEACGFAAKRVDKHNKGGLLKSEIVSFIGSCEIIVADLTNARPNCYLEIGYAMGLDKFANLILTAREDHDIDSPNHVAGGHKIHFDLAGYDILYWSPNDLDVFRVELEKRIKRRLAVIEPGMSTPRSPWDEHWLLAQKSRALGKWSSMKIAGFMEARLALDHPKQDWPQKVLNDAAKYAPINNTGWPIGLYLNDLEEHRPRARADGIWAEIAMDDLRAYDYWALRRSGDFYTVCRMWEDSEHPDKIWFDHRIARTTELLLYCARLYGHLKVDPSTYVSIHVEYAGLKGRTLSAVDQLRAFTLRPRRTTEDGSDANVRVHLSSIESNLVQLVKQLTTPLFVLFDFFEPSDDTYSGLVNQFVKRI